MLDGQKKTRPEEEPKTEAIPPQQPAPGRLFADMTEGYKTESPPEDRGFIGDVASTAGRGTGKAVEMFGRGLQVADFDPDDDQGILDWAGSGLQRAGEAVQEVPAFQPDRAAQEGFAKKTFTGAVESLPLSAGPLAGAAAGAAYGSTIGPVGTVIGGVLGGALPLLLSFGGGTYQEERERAVEHLKQTKPNLTAEEVNQKAHDFGMEKAMWEVGTEAISDVVTAATFGTGKLLMSMGKSGVKAAAAPTLKSVLSLGPKEFSKKFIKAYAVDMPVEALSEMAAYHGQASADAGIGLGDGPALQGYLEAAATAAWMSGVMGVGISGYNASQKEKIARNLSSPNTLIRDRAVDQVAQGISNELGPGQAAGWREMTRQTFESGNKLDISSPIVSTTQDVEARKTQQGVIGKALAAGGLMGVSQAVTAPAPETVTKEQAFKAETVTYNQIQQKIRNQQPLTESEQNFIEKQRKQVGITEQERAEIETELYQRDIEIPGAKEFESKLRRELPAAATPETMTASEEESFKRQSEEYTKLKGKIVSGQPLTREEEISLTRLGGYVPEKETEADRLVKEYQESMKVPRSEYYEEPFYKEKRPSFEERQGAARKGEHAYPVEELTEYEQFERDALEYNRLKNIPKGRRTSGEQLRLDILTNQMDELMKQGKEKKAKGKIDIWRISREKFITEESKKTDHKGDIPTGRILGGHHEKAVIEAVKRGETLPPEVAKEYADTLNLLKEESPKAPKKKPLGEKVLDETGDIRDIRRTLGKNTPKEFQESYRNPEDMSTLTSNPAYVEILPKYTEKLISEAGDIKHDLNNVTFSLADNKEHLFKLFKKAGEDSITIEFQGRSYTLEKPARSGDRIELNREGREVREELLEDYRKADKLKSLPRQGRSISIQTTAQPVTRAAKYGPKTLEQAAQEHLGFLAEMGILTENEAAIKDKILTEIADKLVNKGFDHTFRNEEADTSFSIKRGRRKDYFVDPKNAKKFNELRAKLNEATSQEAEGIQQEIEKLIDPDVAKAFKSAAAELKEDPRLARETKGKLKTAGVSTRQALGKQAEEDYEAFKKKQRANLDAAFKSLSGAPLPTGQQANVADELGSLTEQKGVEIVTPEQASKGLNSASEIKYSKDNKRVEGLTFLDGRVWLVQGNVEKGNSLGVFAHEVGVHARHLGFQDERVFKQILDFVGRTSKLGKDDQVNAARARVPEDTSAADINEETLAYIVSDAPQHNIVKRLVAAIKKFLLEKGWIGIDRLSPENLQAMAQSVMRVDQESVISDRAKLSVSSAERTLGKATQPVTDNDFIINRKQKQIKKTLPRQLRHALRDIRLFVDQYLGAASTRLKNKSPKIAAEFRELDRRTGVGLSKDIQDSQEFLRGMNNMSTEDKADMDYALKNNVTEKVKDLNDKYKLTDHYEKALEVLGRINIEKKDVGYDPDIGWPSIIKDVGGFLEYLDRGNMRAEFTDAIKFTANQMSITPDALDPEIKAEVISNVILGHHRGVEKSDSEFSTITPELNQFYMSSDEALAHYLHNSRREIEARKFFGKVPKKISEAKIRKRSAEKRLRENELSKSEQKQIKDNIKGYEKTINLYKKQRDYTENIATYINDLLIKKEIKPGDKKEIKDILSARFNAKGTEGIVQIYKNLSLIDTLGSPITALTQIGDVGFVMFEAGAVKGARAITKAIKGESRIKYSDIPIEHIAQEFADPGKLSRAVEKLFHATGLSKMDQLGKESLINASFEAYKERAAKNPKKLKKEIRPIFNSETDSVIQDLLNDDVTDNIKVLVYHRLLDFQPAALSEMPEKYLTAGNGRLFYMLKTFTLKQFDVYRREIYQKAVSGDKQDRIDAIKNVTRLAMFLGLANAGADEIKDLILGRETDLEDRVVDNILRLFGVSKFVTWQARREGVGTAIAKQILPPFKFIDAVTKDIISAGDDKGLRTPASIPLVGKFAYWHIGRGADSKQDLWDIRWRKEKKRLNKIQERLNRSSSKEAFIASNKEDVVKSRRQGSIQGSLNRYRKRINKLKALDTTPSTRETIKDLEQRRTDIILMYFDKLK